MNTIHNPTCTFNAVAEPGASTSIPRGSEAAIALAILVAILVVGIAVYLYCRFRRPKLKSG